MNAVEGVKRYVTLNNEWEVTEMLYIDNVYVYCCNMYIGSLRKYFFYRLPSFTSD